MLWHHFFKALIFLPQLERSGEHECNDAVGKFWWITLFSPANPVFPFKIFPPCFLLLFLTLPPSIPPTFSPYIHPPLQPSNESALLSFWLWHHHSLSSLTQSKTSFELFSMIGSCQDARVCVTEGCEGTRRSVTGSRRSRSVGGWKWKVQLWPSEFGSLVGCPSGDIHG